MVDVAVIGAGQTKFGNHALGLKGMWSESAENAFASVDGDLTRLLGALFLARRRALSIRSCVQPLASNCSSV